MQRIRRFVSSAADKKATPEFNENVGKIMRLGFRVEASQVLPRWTRMLSASTPVARQLYAPFYRFQVDGETRIRVVFADRSEKIHALKLNYSGERAMPVFGSFSMTSLFSRLGRMKLQKAIDQQALNSDGKEFNVDDGKDAGEQIPFVMPPAIAFGHYVEPVIQEREGNRVRHFVFTRYGSSNDILRVDHHVALRSVTTDRLWLPMYALDFSPFSPTKSLFVADGNDPGAAKELLSRRYTHYVNGVTGDRLNPLPVPFSLSLLPLMLTIPFDPIWGLLSLPLLALSSYPYMTTLAHHEATRERHGRHQNALAKEPSQWAAMLNDTWFFRKSDTAPLVATAHPDPKGFYRALGLTGREDISAPDLEREYRILIKALHPDRHRQQMSEDVLREQEERLRSVMEAFRILRDGSVLVSGNN